MIAKKMLQGIAFIFAAMVLGCNDAAMFEFRLIEENHNCTYFRELCQNLGYDGLAILSTPEAYQYAMDISANVRDTLGMHIFIGARYFPEYDATLWDDGTETRSDSPFGRHPPKADPNEPCTRLLHTGNFRLTADNLLYYGMCGNQLMTCTGESLRDAGVPTTLLTAKTKTRIGTWNIRTLYEIGRIAQGRRVTIIECDAPINVSAIEEKIRLYGHVQTVIDKVPRRDIRILFGDLNSKVGTDNTDMEHVMGIHGTENGYFFTEICLFNDLVIGGDNANSFGQEDQETQGVDLNRHIDTHH
ncbi:hypothetical protein EGW08_009705 [Elysia chlorotica]|uniref:Endonuclease/exonuclease/phosphatase domain-containing protein n=1 Tax=Elysia chlorotica TaxID=188477 RepID=A0A433TLR6_ELYCH|nr:hypothetical protein EGW08_009705 [Elysia chlorotica]